MRSTPKIAYGQTDGPIMRLESRDSVHGALAQQNFYALLYFDIYDTCKYAFYFQPVF